MDIKHRSKQNTPSYYLPLPYTLAAYKTIPLLEARRWLFDGMMLHLRKVEAPSEAIAVMAYYNQDHHIIGFIPEGVISRLDHVLHYEDQIAVTLESRNCSVLKNAFWITIEELPNLSELGLNV